MVVGLFNTVFGWIKDSRWRKKCKRLVKRANQQLLIQKRRMESIIRQSKADIAQLIIYGQQDKAVIKAERHHSDEHLLSVYGQIEKFCNSLYANLPAIGGQTPLSREVNEAAASLAFAASRCGELSVLHRVRRLLNKRFGNEFDRASVGLQPGNFVNPQIVYNLGNISVPRDVKFKPASYTARDYTLLMDPQTDEQSPGSPQVMVSIRSDFCFDELGEDDVDAWVTRVSSNRFVNGSHEWKEIEEDKEHRLPYVHPKLPDYDELVVKFAIQQRAFRERRQ